MSRSQLLILAAAVALLAAGGVVFSRCGTSPRKTTSKPKATPAPTARTTPAPAAPIDDPGDVPEDDPMSPRWHPPAATIGRPLIDSIEVEPKTACAGAQVKVTTKAHHPEGNTAELFYSVGDQRGNPNVVDVPNVAGPFHLLVAAFDREGDYHQIPTKVEVIACPPEDMPLVVEARPLIHPEVFGFKAKLPARTGEAKWTYSWDFGDGKTAQTTDPYVEHDYGGRTDHADTMNPSFLVKVRAQSDQGETLEGSASASILNLYYVNRELKGVVVPEVRLLRVDYEGDTAVATYSVKHFEHGPIALSQISGTLGACDTTSHASRPATVGLDALDVTSLSPGDTTLKARLARGTDCTAVLDVLGRAPGGQEVRFSLGMRLNQPHPTEFLDPRQAKDPAAQARLDWLARAAKLLGKDMSKPGTTLSDEEIRRLVQSGKIEPMPAGPSTPPPPNAPGGP